MKPDRIAVAWSGGRDSTGAAARRAGGARTAGVEVVALHVHHGLSPNADPGSPSAGAGAALATAGYAVRLRSTRSAAPAAVGDNIEAWARRSAMPALRRMARWRSNAPAPCCWRTTAATRPRPLLLQALRGAGVSQGLAGMPREIERDGIPELAAALAGSHPREPSPPMCDATA